MNEVIFIVEQAPEGGYVARALGHSIYTEADTWNDLKTATHDAVVCHWSDEERPPIIRLHFLREEVVAA